MQQQPYIVYIKADDYGRITAINSSAFLHDITEWIKIDEGFEDKHHHAQNNYFALSIYDEQGCHNWYYVDSQPVPATPEQKAAELAARPKPEPTMEQRLETVEQTKAETVTVENLSKTLDIILTDVIPTLIGE